MPFTNLAEEIYFCESCGAETKPSSKTARHHTHEKAPDQGDGHRAVSNENSITAGRPNQLW